MGEYLSPDDFDMPEELVSTIDAWHAQREIGSRPWEKSDPFDYHRSDAWAEQGTDFAVGEKMLSHKLGKIAEAYLDTKVTDLRLQALNTHVAWLLSLKKTCFLLV
jgi:hypothetical protein